MFLLIAAAAAAGPATPLMPQGQQANCPRTTTYHAVQQGRPPQPQRLTELPPANAYAAVYRRVAGCEVPVVVRYGVGR